MLRTFRLSVSRNLRFFHVRRNGVNALAKNGASDAIALLQSMQVKLHSRGLNRLPQRSDFTEAEIVQIKAHLGAFPRALEAAGLKPRDPAAAERKQAKRIAQKRRRTAAKIRQQEKDTPAPPQPEEGEPS